MHAFYNDELIIIDRARIKENNLDQQLDKLKDFLSSDLASEHLSQTSESKRQWLIQQLASLKSHTRDPQQQPQINPLSNIRPDSYVNRQKDRLLQNQATIRCASTGQSDYKANYKQVSLIICRKIALQDNIYLLAISKKF